MTVQQLPSQLELETQAQVQREVELGISLELEEKPISQEPWFEEFCKFQCGTYYRSFEELNPDLNIRS